MEVNQNPWDYYKPGFIDPMYQSYQNKKISYPNAEMCGGRPLKISNSMIGRQYGGNPCVVTDNTTKRNGCGAVLHPELIRENWNQTFQRKHSMDPCPAGWTKGSVRGDADYMCHREIDADTLGGRTYNFYTDIRTVQHIPFSKKERSGEVNAYGRVSAVTNKNDRSLVSMPQKHSLIGGLSKGF